MVADELSVVVVDIDGVICVVCDRPGIDIDADDFDGGVPAGGCFGDLDMAEGSVGVIEVVESFDGRGISDLHREITEILQII